MMRMMPSAKRNRNEPTRARYSGLDIYKLASILVEGKRTSIIFQ